MVAQPLALVRVQTRYILLRLVDRVSSVCKQSLAVRLRLRGQYLQRLDGVAGRSSRDRSITTSREESRLAGSHPKLSSSAAQRCADAPATAMGSLAIF